MAWKRVDTRECRLNENIPVYGIRALVQVVYISDGRTTKGIVIIYMCVYIQGVYKNVGYLWILMIKKVYPIKFN